MEKYIVFMDQKNQYCEKIVYYPKQSIDSMQSYQSTKGIFHRSGINNFTICMETQKTSNHQSNLEKKEWNWRNQLA